MKIKIYMIDIEKDEKRLAFTCFETAARIRGTEEIDASIYDCVFSGEVDCDGLEDVYSMFNGDDRPGEYRGRSLSVSDVVEVLDSDIIKEGFYFCDTFGFKPVEFDPEKAAPLKDDMIRVLMVEPGKLAYPSEIGSSLEDIYEALDCDTIEVLYPVSDMIVIVCDEEGKLNGAVPNRAVHDDSGEIVDIIHGKFFICDCSGDHFGSLPQDMMEKYRKKFLYPERFLHVNEHIIAIKYDPERTEAR